MTRAGSLCSGVGGRHLRACDWDVRTADRGVLVALVEQFHYSHSAANTAVYRHGLFLVDEVDALDDDGNEYVMQRAAGWVHSVSPEEVGVLGLWRESDEVYEALPNELTRRETGGEA